MSADNYYLVRPHPQGGWTFTMEFASDEGYGPVPSNSPRLADASEAVAAAASAGWTEYGVHVNTQANPNGACELDQEAARFRQFLVANMFDGDDGGHLGHHQHGMKISSLLDEMRDLYRDWVSWAKDES